MDNAQFPKTGGTWTNRVKMMVNKEPAWVTVPVVRSYHGVLTVREMKINERQPWRARLMRTIEMSYGRAPHFAEVAPLLRELVEQPTPDLATYNLTAIHTFCARLDLTTPIVLGSSLATEGQSTDLLISMVRAVGGTRYLAGGGASGYQDDAKFDAMGLELVYQNFQHPRYSQANSATFTPGLSIVDALMNCGFEGVCRLMDGRAPD